MKAADLAGELERGGAKLLGSDRGIEVKERFFVSAHCGEVKTAKVEAGRN